LCKLGPEIAGGGLGGLFAEKLSEAVLRRIRYEQNPRFEKRGREMVRVGRIARWGRVGARGGVIGAFAGAIVGHYVGKEIEDRIEQVCNQIDF
jgi:hypothetical protein